MNVAWYLNKDEDKLELNIVGVKSSRSQLVERVLCNYWLILALMTNGGVEY